MVISVRFPAELDHSIHGPEEELWQNSLLKRTWRNGILPECFLLQYVRNLRILLWCKTAKLSNRIFTYFTLFPPPSPQILQLFQQSKYHNTAFFIKPKDPIFCWLCSAYSCGDRKITHSQPLPNIIIKFRFSSRGRTK